MSNEKRFEYNSKTGELWACNGDFCMPLATGYAGKGRGWNNPSVDNERSLGPLPRGTYAMRVDKHPRFAEPAIRLTQTSGFTHDRSGFWIHGDNARGDGSASAGCIVLGRPVRLAIASFIALGFNELLVHADPV